VVLLRYATHQLLLWLLLLLLWRDNCSRLLLRLP
jgi:hypothetical protein